jgi:thiamine biosynthesis lipoprotein
MSEPDLVRVVDRRVVMGVESTIVCWAPSVEGAREATRLAFGRMAELEQAISDYRPRSESMLAARIVGRTLPISESMLDALACSSRWHEWSGGAFDPTIGPLTTLWREARREGGLPDGDAIDALRSSVGWSGLEIDFDADPATILFRSPGMRLDFGGLGKGLAADLALETMIERGLPRTLVDVGGDLVAGNPPPGRSGWRVTVQTVGWDDEIILDLHNGAIATSGDVHQYLEVEKDGARVRIGHQLDARTGAPVSTRREATAVVRGGARSGADADALASVLAVLGFDRVREIAPATGLDVGIRVVEAISPDADGDDPSGWMIQESGFTGGESIEPITARP